MLPPNQRSEKRGAAVIVLREEWGYEQLIKMRGDYVSICMGWDIHSYPSSLFRKRSCSARTTVANIAHRLYNSTLWSLLVVSTRN